MKATARIAGRRCGIAPVPRGGGDGRKEGSRESGRKGSGSRAGGGGFTLIELMVVVAIISVLIAILVPATARAMAIAKALRCRGHLHGIYQAMMIYANEHGDRMPAAPGTEGLINSVGTARNVAPVATAPTPVSATIWLLARSTGLASDMFACPSSPQAKDSAGPLDPEIWDFESSKTLSYAIQYPYGGKSYFDRPVVSPSQMPIMADRGPFFGDGGDLSGMPADSFDSIDRWLADPANRAKVNSANHGGTGQNVVFADGHADWFDRPTIGPRQDNIYTIQDADTPPGRMHGHVPSDTAKEPANSLDTVLVY